MITSRTAGVAATLAAAIAFLALANPLPLWAVKWSRPSESTAAINDDEARRIVPGVWTENMAEDDWRIAAEATFSADGSYSSVGTLTDPDGQQELYARGAWAIEDGYLVYEIVDTNIPLEHPTIRDRILTLEQDRIVYESEWGQTFTMVRKAR